MADSGIRYLLRQARAAGFTTQRAKSGHWKIRAADGRLVATCAGTPSDHRGVRNLAAALRRAGALR